MKPSHRLSESRHRKLAQLLNRCRIADTSGTDWELLDLALTHPSLDASVNNDRLEFLGDAVLRFLVGDFLYRTYPTMAVGQLSLLRADLLSNAFFAELADIYEFEGVLAIGSSARNDAKGRKKRLADALEATVGALYLSWIEQETDVWKPRLDQWLSTHLEQRALQQLQDIERHNPKTALQEYTQARWGDRPEYRYVQTPGTTPQTSQVSKPVFTVEVWIQSHCWGAGVGPSKKAAEMQAAATALDKLRESQ